MMNYKISVIVAVYKAEKYFERCLRSLFEQTMTEIEYIFIDDCSPDNSMGVLERVAHEYPSRQPHIKVIHHSQNRGIASARKSGLAAASGDFIAACDPDDWIDPETYDELYRFANDTNSDVVISDYIREYSDHSEEAHRDFDILTGEEFAEAHILGGIEGFLWDRIIRRNILHDNGLSTIDGVNMCEDLMLNLALSNHIKKATYIHKAFYHYDQYSNTSSLRNNTIINPDQRSKFTPQIKNWIDFADNNFRNNKSQHNNLITIIAYWAYVKDLYNTHDFRLTFRPYRDEIRQSQQSNHIKILLLLFLHGIKISPKIKDQIKRLLRRN